MQSDILLIFVNVPAVWKQNTDFILSWNQIFFTMDDQIKQQEVTCLYAACTCSFAASR